RQAIELRKQGYSYKEIERTLKVSRSTLSRWLPGVPTGDEYRLRVRKAQQRRNEKVRQFWEKKQTEVFENYEPPMQDAFFTLGLGLYWGEGTKAELAIANADPGVIRIFIRWMNRFFGGRFERFVVGVVHHSPHRDDEVRAYWSKAID